MSWTSAAASAMTVLACSGVPAVTAGCSGGASAATPQQRAAAGFLARYAHAALAAATWTIRPGGAIAATSGRATVSDATSGISFMCKSLSARGTLKSGSGLPGADAGSITAAGFHTCESPFGLVRARRLILTLRAADLPWHLNLSSASGGAVTGAISHIQIHVTTSSCLWVLDGTAATAGDGVIGFRYTSSTGKLALLTTGGDLHAYNVRGCAGLIHDGDTFTIRATFTLSPRQAITSP